MERIISRTVKSLVAKTLVVSTESGKGGEKYYHIPVSVPEKKRLSFLKDHYETDTLKIACIMDTVERESLYCMTEDVFLSLAVAVNDISEYRKLLKESKKEKENAGD